MLLSVKILARGIYIAVAENTFIILQHSSEATWTHGRERVVSYKEFPYSSAAESKPIGHVRTAIPWLIAPVLRGVLQLKHLYTLSTNEYTRYKNHHVW